MNDSKLLALIKVLDLDTLQVKNRDNFGVKMRVQAAAYLLQYLGEDGFDYSFSTYFRGPYSVDLGRGLSLLAPAEPGKAHGLHEVARAVQPAEA
jgi:hypothetical protein